MHRSIYSLRFYFYIEKKKKFPSVFILESVSFQHIDIRLWSAQKSPETWEKSVFLRIIEQLSMNYLVMFMKTCEDWFVQWSFVLLRLLFISIIYHLALPRIIVVRSFWHLRRKLFLLFMITIIKYNKPQDWSGCSHE